MPAVSERRLLGAEKGEAWTELRTPFPGLALPLTRSGGNLDLPLGVRGGVGGGFRSKKSATSKGPHPISGVPEPQGRRDPSGPQRQALQRAEIKEIENNQPPITGFRGGFYSVIYVKALRNFVMGPCKCRVIKVIIIFTTIVKSPSRQGLQRLSCSSGHLTDGKTEVWDLR